MTEPDAIEFYYDFACPYAYLASTQIERVAARGGRPLVYRPFLLGGVFKALHNDVRAKSSAARLRMNALDVQRWADHWGVPLAMPAGHPLRTVNALRAVLAAGNSPRLVHALFRAYWVEGRDVGDDVVLTSILDAEGFDGHSILERAADTACKDDLRQRTEEAIERGVFGAPTIFFRGELYFGQDRLWMVEKALERSSGAPRAPDAGTPAPQPGARTVEFWYDFSSPFAYLGSTQVEALARRTGAELVWRPFLLGALFKKIGTADVPIATFPAAKQRYYATDMNRHAVEYGVPFQFPSRFPAKTVTALRAAICAGEQIGRLTHAVFRAYWVQDRDIGDSAELARVLSGAGLDPKLVERAGEQGAKDELFRATEQAAEHGLCGAPSYVVGDLVFWGQDRSMLVEKALRGWRPRAEAR